MILVLKNVFGAKIRIITGYPGGGEMSLAMEKGEIAEGDPVDELVRAARYQEAELIVVGSRGLGAIAGALLGSVSRALVQHSPVAVLVVKERVGAELAERSSS